MNAFLSRVALVGDPHTGKTHFLKTLKGSKPILKDGQNVHSSIFTYRYDKHTTDVFNIQFIEFEDIYPLHNSQCILYFCSMERPESIQNLIYWYNRVHSNRKRNRTRKNKEATYVEFIICTSKTYGKDDIIEFIEQTADYLEIPVLLYNGSMYSVYNICESFMNELLSNNKIKLNKYCISDVSLNEDENVNKLSFDGEIVYNYIYYPYSSLPSRWYEHIANKEYSDASMCDMDSDDYSFGSNRRISIIDSNKHTNCCCFFTK